MSGGDEYRRAIPPTHPEMAAEAARKQAAYAASREAWNARSYWGKVAGAGRESRGVMAAERDTVTERHARTMKI